MFAMKAVKKLDVPIFHDEEVLQERETGKLGSACRFIVETKATFKSYVNNTNKYLIRALNQSIDVF